MEIATTILIYTSVLGFILGYVVNKTNFCTMGAVSDLVNIGDSSRLKAWFLAITVAILGVTFLEYTGTLNANDSRIPYRNSVFFWPRYIIGGVMFGIGMTLASGCGNKILIREYNNGERKKLRLDYKPSLFYETKDKNTKFKSLDGKSLKKITFPSISEAKQKIRDTEGVTSWYGMTQFIYPFIF